MDRLTWREFWVSAIPILVSAVVPILLWLTTEDEETADALMWLPRSLLGKLVLQAGIVAGALGAHYLLKSRQITDQQRWALQADLSEFLDKAVRLKHIDPDGELNARMNVMTKEWRIGHLLERRGQVKIRALCEHTDLPESAKVTRPSAWRLYVFACTRNMRHSHAAGKAWRKGVGLVGRHWATGDNIGFAVLPPDEEANVRTHQEEWNMDEQEAHAHRRTRCVISLQMYDQLGPEQQVVGYLNLSSSSADAVGRWIQQDDIRPEVAGVLKKIAETIIRETRLVQLSRSMLG